MIGIIRESSTALFPRKCGSFLNQGVDPLQELSTPRSPAKMQSMELDGLSVIIYYWYSPNLCFKEEKSAGLDSTARRGTGEAKYLHAWPPAFISRDIACRLDHFLFQCSLFVAPYIYLPQSNSLIRLPNPSATFFALTYAAWNMIHSFMSDQYHMINTLIDLAVLYAGLPAHGILIVVNQ